MNELRAEALRDKRMRFDLFRFLYKYGTIVVTLLAILYFSVSVENWVTFGKHDQHLSVRFHRLPHRACDDDVAYVDGLTFRPPLPRPSRPLSRRRL